MAGDSAGSGSGGDGDAGDSNSSSLEGRLGTDQKLGIKLSVVESLSQ